jgi:hypothetical protein
LTVEQQEFPEARFLSWKTMQGRCCVAARASTYVCMPPQGVTKQEHTPPAAGAIERVSTVCIAAFPAYKRIENKTKQVMDSKAHCF